MTKKMCSLLLTIALLCSHFMTVLASEAVDQVICTTTLGGDYDQLEQTILQGIYQDGSVAWSYDTGMKERGNESNVYWYGQSGNLFFLNYKGSLQAFDTGTGKILWSTPEGEYSFCQGIFDQAGNLCMINTHGPMTLLDRDGNVLARYNTDRKYSSLIIGSATLENNRITIKYAVEKDGTEIKEYNDYQTMPSLSIDLSPYQNRIQITIDGNLISSDVPPFIEQDRTFVPVRAIFEALGAEVSWDGQTKTVTATKNDTTIQLKIGIKEINVNGTTTTLDVSPQIISDRTMVPVRAVSEGFGCAVGWDGQTKTVTISTASESAEQPSQSEPLPLTVNTDLLSYLGQTYGALSASLGTVSEVSWHNGPYCKLGNLDLWFGFGDGTWYQTNTEYQLSEDLICNSLMMYAGTLVPQIPPQTPIASVASALGATATEPEQNDLDGNYVSHIQYNQYQISIFVSENGTVSSDTLIAIS